MPPSTAPQQASPRTPVRRLAHRAVETPERLTVTAWRDPIVEARGHRPGSAYVDAVWLGVLGPSTVLCWGRLARLAAIRPEARVDTVDLARSLGLGDGLGRNAPLSRTLARMVGFGVATRTNDTLAVRLALADVPYRHLPRLSRSAQLAHQQWATNRTTATNLAATPERAVTR